MLNPKSSTWPARKSRYLKARPYIDKIVPPGEIKVFSLGSVMDSYTTHEVAVFFQSAFGENIADLLFTGQKPERQGIRLMRFRIPPTLLGRTASNRPQMSRRESNGR